MKLSGESPSGTSFAFGLIVGTTGMGFPRLFFRWGVRGIVQKGAENAGESPSACKKWATCPENSPMKYPGYRSGHRFGNRMLTGLVKHLFGYAFEDILSGYRVMSQRFVKSFPVHSHGFEIETEMSVHALQLGLPVAEVPTKYGVRPEDSQSKLRTYRDGFRILFTIVSLLTTERPRLFFGVLALLLTLLSFILATPIVCDYFATGIVKRFPTAFLCLGLVLLAVQVVIFGFLLHSVRRGRVEVKRLAYLAQKGHLRRKWIEERVGQDNAKDCHVHRGDCFL